MSEWNNNLFGCFRNKQLCLIGTFCFPCLLLVNRMRANKLHDLKINPWWIISITCCCLPMYSCIQGAGRYYIREKYNLPQEPCHDNCVHCFCCICAACQEVNELNVRAAPTMYTSEFCGKNIN